MRHTIITLIVGLIVLSGSATAADTEKDTRLSRAAYSALQADPELAELNLGVRVEQGGVAVIWGMVPNKQSLLKAEKAIEGIRGVTAIRNQCELIAPTDVFLKEVSEALKGVKQPTPPTIPPLPVDDFPGLPGKITPASPIKSPISPEVPSEAPSETTPVSYAPPPPASDGLGRNTTTLKPKFEPPPPASNSVPLGRSVARSQEPDTQLTVIDYRMIERIRSSDRQYEGLKLELRDGRVVITGRVTDPAIVWELADKIGPYVGKRSIVVNASVRR